MIIKIGVNTPGRSRGRSMVGILGRVGTAATGGTIAQLLGHAMLTAMGLG